MAKRTEDLFDDIVPIHKQFLPKIQSIGKKPAATNIWDIPYTIPQLAYLTHPHFRYYGKFPSVVAGQLLEQFAPPTPSHYVLDNFAGSGTTFVEAKLRKIQSYGIDISWLAVLASRVKSRFVDTQEIELALNQVCSNASKIEVSAVPDNPIVEKWFDDDVAADLVRLQEALVELAESATKEFLVVAFLAILRRVSKAYDGEVRPHINKTKKKRDVLPAFRKKVMDMIAGHNDYMHLADRETIADCYLADNRSLPDRFDDGHCYMVISHPPYLNSFDYSPVYKIEYYWGAPFEYLVEDAHAFDRKAAELKAHPANEKVTASYYEHLKQCYEETFRIQQDGGLLAIVIGDCTRMKVLEPVIDKTIDIVEDIGYSLLELNFRTTHYGLGKYAYDHRADYHGEAEKRDAIIVFSK